MFEQIVIEDNFPTVLEAEGTVLSDKHQWHKTLNTACQQVK